MDRSEIKCRDILQNKCESDLKYGFNQNMGNIENNSDFTAPARNLRARSQR